MPNSECKNCEVGIKQLSDALVVITDLTAERDQLRAALAVATEALGKIRSIGHKQGYNAHDGTHISSQECGIAADALSTPAIAAEHERREKLEAVVEAARSVLIDPLAPVRTLAIQSLQSSLATLDGTAVPEQPK